MHELHYVGRRMQRPDALAKATGAAQYTADLVVHRRDVLHAKALYPPYGHAKILRIDTSKAAALPGVAIVMTADDLPGENGYGGMIHDKPVIAKDEVFYEGDPVALVAAEDLKTAEKAVSLIEVEYEPLESYDSPADMLREDAPVLHREYPIPRKGNISDEVLIRKGDVKTAFEDADVVVDNWYKTPMLDHAYLEPDCALAEPDPVQGGITIYSPQHAVQLAKKALCGAFNMPQSKIRVISQVVGGGFGGKEDSTFDASVVAGVLAIKTGRPVFYELTRDEVFKNTGKRHAAAIHHRLAADKEGNILGIEVDSIIDKGAWKSIDAIPSRTAQYAGSVYRIDNALTHSWSVFTDHPYGCAFRGLGCPQATFAVESQMDELAEKLGIDPIDLRMKNLLRPGDTTIWGQEMLEERGFGIAECLTRVREAIGWDKPLTPSEDPDVRRGKGVACYMYGTGTGYITDGAHCFVQAQPDGSLNIGISSNELGQGFLIAMRQIAADTFGVPIEKVYLDFSDSAASVEAGATVASRTTVFLGNAVMNGCNVLRERFLPVAAQMLGAKKEDLDVDNGFVFDTTDEAKRVPYASVISKAFAMQIPLACVGSWYPPKAYADENGQGVKMHTYAFAAQAAIVSVHVKTGEVAVDDTVLAVDVGHAINPDTVEGQMHGGMAQAIGWSLMEEEFMKDGKMRNHTFHDYLIPTAMDLPKLRTIIVEHPNSLGPYGAKGIGEPPIVGAAPAIHNAIRNAVGVSINELPMTPVRVLDALRKARAEQ